MQQDFVSRFQTRMPPFVLRNCLNLGYMGFPRNFQFDLWQAPQQNCRLILDRDSQSDVGRDGLFGCLLHLRFCGLLVGKLGVRHDGRFAGPWTGHHRMVGFVWSFGVGLVNIDLKVAADVGRNDGCLCL